MCEVQLLIKATNEGLHLLRSSFESTGRYSEKFMVKPKCDHLLESAYGELFSRPMHFSVWRTSFSEFRFHQFDGHKG